MMLQGVDSAENLGPVIPNMQLLLQVIPGVLLDVTHGYPPVFGRLSNATFLFQVLGWQLDYPTFLPRISIPFRYHKACQLDVPSLGPRPLKLGEADPSICSSWQALHNKALTGLQPHPVPDRRLGDLLIPHHVIHL